MSNNAVNSELITITPFIEKMITPVNENGQDVITNLVNPSYVPEHWKAFDERRMVLNSDANYANYTVDTSCDYLISSKLTFELPPIRVKPEYEDTVRISWCPNIGHNVVKNARFFYGSVEYGYIDSTYLDINSQYSMSQKEGSRDEYSFYCGNHPQLIDFGTKLPKFTIDVNQPWYYSQHADFAFPILYARSAKNLYHRYEFRLKVNDLIRVQQYNSSTELWENVTKSISKFSQYLDISSDVISTPELWGYYSILSKDAKSQLLDCFIPQQMYIRDVIARDCNTGVSYRHVAEIEIEAGTPATAIFWVAENFTASKNNNYSNYTTNSHDLRDGWDPIKTNTLSYGTDNKFKDMTSNHFSKRRNFLSSPLEAGYHAYNYAWDPTGSEGDVAVDIGFLRAKLKCLLYNSDINEESSYLRDEDVIEYDEENQSNNAKNNSLFKLKVRILVLRHLTINRSDDGFNIEIN